MNSTLKTVASFSETGWKPLGPGASCDAHEVFEAWREDEANPIDLFSGVEHGIEWQEVDGETMAYRINECVLLVVGWSYDAEWVNDGWRGTLTIESWHMGTEAAQ